MPFDIKDAKDKISDKLTGMRTLTNIARNPFYTAILIMIIIMLIVLWVFRGVDFEDEEEGLFKLTARIGVYGLIFITGITFLHNHLLYDEFKLDQDNNEKKSVFGGVVDESEAVAIKPSATNEFISGEGVSFL